MVVPMHYFRWIEVFSKLVLIKAILERRQRHQLKCKVQSPAVSTSFLFTLLLFEDFLFTLFGSTTTKYYFENRLSNNLQRLKLALKDIALNCFFSGSWVLIESYIVTCCVKCLGIYRSRKMLDSANNYVESLCRIETCKASNYHRKCRQAMLWYHFSK